MILRVITNLFFEYTYINNKLIISICINMKLFFVKAASKSVIHAK